MGSPQPLLEPCGRKYGAEIHTFVLMSNHFHLILSTPKQNLDSVMRWFLAESTRAMLRRSARLNHVYGSRYHWTVLDSAWSLAYVFKYVYRNPVRGGICNQVQEYPFSTLNRWDHPIALSEGYSQYWQFIPRDVETGYNG